MDPELVIANLKKRCDYLEGRIQLLEDTLFKGYTPPFAWGLTQSEARVMAVLVCRDVATRTTLMCALYSDLPGDAPNAKIIDVFICKLRKKLRPFGARIINVHGVGYRLADRLAFLPEAN